MKLNKIITAFTHWDNKVFIGLNNQINTLYNILHSKQ